MIIIEVMKIKETIASHPKYKVLAKQILMKHT